MKKVFSPIIFVFAIFTTVFGQNYGDFRTIASGYWSDYETTWQFFNGSSWTTAPWQPSASDEVITIRSGHTVTTDFWCSYTDQCIVESGATLIDNSSQFKISNGSGVDLDVYGTLIVNVSLATNSSSEILIRSGGNVVFGSSGQISNNGNFTLSSGATFTTANTSGVNGSLTTGGTKSLNTGANFEFNGSSAQVSGSYMPSTINNLMINNSAGVTMSQSTTIGGTLTLTSGSLSIGANTLTLNGSTSISSGSLTGGTSSNIIIGGYGASTTIPTVTLNDLTINRANGISLGGNVTINGTVTLTSGDIDLNGFILTLGSSATLSESNGNTIKGTSGVITTTRSLNNISGQDIGGLGAIITTSADLGNTTITRGHNAQTGGGNSGILRYFDINPSNNSGLNATLSFKYDESELNSISEANLALYRSTDGGTTWSCRGGAVDSYNNRVTLDGIDAFSRWTLGGTGDQSLPVTLSAFSAKVVSNGIALNWITESEIENLGFNIFRKIYGGEYILIAGFKDFPELTGHGTTTEKNSYSYIDKAVQPSETYIYLLSDVCYNGLENKHFDNTVIVKTPVNQPGIAENFRIGNIYPNPFNAAFTLPLMLSNSSPIKLTLYNVSGEVVKIVPNTIKPVGEHIITIDCNDLSAGLYFLQIATLNSIQIRKCILLK